MNLKNLSIATRLKCGFGLVLVFSALLGTVAWFQLQRLGDITAEINDSWMVSVADLNVVMDVLSEARRNDYSYVLLPDDKARDAADAQRAVMWKRLVDPTRRYEATGISGPSEQKLYDTFKAAFSKYQESWPKLRELARGDESRHAKALEMLNGESNDRFIEAKALLMKDLAFNVEGAANMKTKAQNALSQSLVLIVGSLVAILVLGGGIAIWIARSISVPLNQAKHWATTIASGDLSTSMPSTAKDETGQLLVAIGDMQYNLARIVGQVRASSDTIATGSAQIATGNADLSQRTEEQASNLQQTAASMEQISGAVKTSTDTAFQANRLALSASSAASKGGEMVGTVVSTMDEIAASSKKIADIIGVIDGIAFQTNILALNAAVEAARAGEQGRGFAVVASEVRNLASRSAEAAKEIKALISASVEKVEVGTRQVNDAGQSMVDIVSQVQRVSQLISELTNASAEQSTGVSQVGDAIMQLDQVTQQNAALVEESAAAAESLKHQAANLAEVVSVFKLTGSHGETSTLLPVKVPAVEHRPVSNMTSSARPEVKPRPVTPLVSRHVAPVATLVRAREDGWEKF